MKKILLIIIITTVTLGWVPLAHADITGGLVNKWTFDGKTIIQNIGDTAGTNNGVLVGQPTTTSPGKIGQALRFDAVDDQVRISDVTFAADFTIALWLYWTGTGASAYSGLVTNTSGNGNAALYINASKLDMYTSGDNFNNTTLKKGQWYHVIVTRSGTTATFYLNGASDGSFTTSQSYTLQRFGTDDISESFAGMMDDIRFYNRALSATDVWQLYNTGKIVYNTHQSVSSSTQPTNMLAWYTFDGKDIDWNRNIVRDVSGKGNDLAFTSLVPTSTSVVVGKVGQAINFNNDNAMMSSATDFVGTSDATFSAWLRPSALGAPSVSTSFGVWVGNDHFKCSTDGRGNNVIDFRNDNNTQSASLSNTVSTSTWVFATITRAGTAVSIYINGKLSASNTNDAPAAGTKVTVGNRTGFDQPFKGTIDDLKIFSGAMTAQQVLNLYTQGRLISNTRQSVASSTIPIGLVGWWTFDGKDIDWNKNTIFDLSVQGNSASTTGMSTTTSPRVGKIGQGLYFDGVNNHMVNVGSKASLQLTTTGTISAWVKGACASYCAIAGIGDLNVELNTAQIAFRSSNLFWLELADGSTRIRAQSTTAFPTNTPRWNFFVGTWDGTNANLYVNGILEAQTAQTLNPVTNVYPFKIGSDQSGVTYNANVTIDDVRVYNRALSASEVRGLYQSGLLTNNK